MQKEYPSRRLPTDEEAVCSCYNSLPTTDGTVKKVKDKYLSAVITGITRYTQSEVRLPIHVGTTYEQKVEEWKKKKFDEYVSAVMILNFDQLRENLYADFDKMIKTAEEEGAFEKEDKEYREKLRKFWASIDLRTFRKLLIKLKRECLDFQILLLFFIVIYFFNIIIPTKKEGLV